jgi:Tc toxin complex TcA C-terminal TcB-binding domain
VDQQQAQNAAMVAALLALLPDFSIGVAGFGASPVSTLSIGSTQVGALANAFQLGHQADAAGHAFNANQAEIQGQWDRRSQDWGFQLQTATDELTQIQAQISTAKIRVNITQDDFNNLNLQIKNAQAVQDFLTNKYTNTQLYSWMVDQTSTVFFQCYQMVYDLAARAEAAFRFERGLTTSSYIQFGYWDSLKKGLMSGERLYADLKRMEIAYLETDVREYEIAKSISLVLFDPLALITLKQMGQCQINLPEAFFDMDYPGHYFRRLKTVSLTIPCVTGPYTNVNCTLTLINSKIRVDSTAASKQDYGNDAHFITSYAATQSIATSTAQNDSGLFEVNFRDERYLPFEGAGLISTWQIDMPLDCNAFNFDTITDVVINLRYTARYGGDILRDFAKQAAVMPARAAQSFTGSIQPFPMRNNLQRVFSLKHEFPTEWYKFLNPAETAPAQSMAIALGNERFPFQYRNKTINISQVEIALIFQSSYSSGSLSLQLGPPGGTSTNIPLNINPQLGGAGWGIANPVPPLPSASGAPRSWILTLGTPIPPSLVAPGIGGGVNRLNPAAIDDIFLLCTFSAK